LLFHTPQDTAKTSQLLPPLGSLTLWNGTAALLHSLKLDENGKWNWTTVAGISGTFHTEEIDNFDLGRKNAFYLTDLKPVLIEQSLFFDHEVPVQTDALTMFRTFRANKIIPKAANTEKILPPQPRSDSRQNNIPDHPIPGLEGFVLEGVSYEHGLTVPAKTVLEYVLPESFTAFQTVAGIDDRLRPNGGVRLRIQADQQQIGDWLLRGDEPAKPLKINLPSGTKTLKFEVDFAEGLTVPAALTLGEPKLIK
jgi:hypothetical protein